MSVRIATLDDAAPLGRLFAELKRHHQAINPANPRYGLDRAACERLTRADLVDPAVTILVAILEKEVRGFAKLIVEDKPWGLSCEVETLIVDENLRGRGIGTLLMEAAEKTAAEAGALGIRVNVLRLNQQARSFYQRRDYEAIAVRYGKPLPPSPPSGG
ncbi:MAG: GNAT family N-acetyltransferase [Actinomycetota bacterium]|nr:GNAT family N-acetyltransferase [Actinomycetota bacterium]